MSPRSIDDKKIKPGILIDRELWDEFKKRFDGTASKKIEELMRNTLSPPEVVATVYSSSNIESINFNQVENWNMSYSNNSLKVENIVYSVQDSTGKIIEFE